jgi:hypothetical protein
VNLGIACVEEKIHRLLMDCEDAKCSHVAREREWSTGFREHNIKPGGVRIRRSISRQAE